MKRRIIILILSMMPLISMARTDMPRITFGAEWSYMATLYTSYHYNYFSPEGYRFNVADNHFGLYNNGELLLHIGYNLDEYRNLSVYAGMNGLADFHNAVPISIRFTRYYGDNPLKDKWFSFFDVGSGLTISSPVQCILSAKAGCGYRISLSRDSKLDFITGVRNTYTQPEVYHENEAIGIEHTNRNDAFLMGLFLGMSLTF